MNDQVTILVSGCDKYSDAWMPFFTLFERYGGELAKHPIVLSSETKEYDSSNNSLNVITINDQVTSHTWSERMIHTLERIDTKYIVFLLEDFFLEAPVNYDAFEKALQLMDKDNNICAINLTHTGKPHRNTDEMFFERDFAPLKIVFTAFLYRTDSLKKLLRKHEDIWHFEQYAGVRALKMGMSVKQYNEIYPPIYQFHPTTIGIIKGKWNTKTKEFLDKEGIDVDYNRIGVFAEEIGNIQSDVPPTFVKRICSILKNRISYWKSTL